MQLADFQKMESVRARVDAVVKDEATAAALKPCDNQFCKRPCFHDEYLDAFNLPTVELVDTEGRGVEAITEHGIVAGGREYKNRLPDLRHRLEVGTSYVAARATSSTAGTGSR